MLFAQDLPIKICNNEVLLQIKVTPNASSNRIGKIFQNSLKIYVTSPPEDGQANKAVIELLAKELKTAKSNITIKNGLTQQNKLISIVKDKERIIKYLQILL